jgi:hypothetical protein
MKTAYLLLALASVALGAELKIDHVTVAGPSLAPLQSALDKLGIRYEYGGPHSNHATEMSIASFADGSYLELIAIQPQADPAAVARHAWAKYMQNDAGPCAWAVRPENLEGEANRLRELGIAVSAVNKSGRLRPDGFRLDWETAQVGTEGNGVYFPFLIHDSTPRDKRAFPGGHPNNPGILGVTQVVIAVGDLDASIARYRKAYGLSEPKRAGNRASFAGTPVILVVAPDRVKRFGEGVYRFGIETVEHQTIEIVPRR